MRKEWWFCLLFVFSDAALAVSREFGYDNDLEHMEKTREIRKNNEKMARMMDAMHLSKKKQQEKFRALGKYVRDDSIYGNVLERKVYEDLREGTITEGGAVIRREFVLHFYEKLYRDNTEFENDYRKVINPGDYVIVEGVNGWSVDYNYLERKSLSDNMVFSNKSWQREWVCKVNDFTGYLYQDGSFVKEFVDHPLCIFYNTKGKARFARELNPVDDPEEYLEKEKERMKKEEYEEILKNRVGYYDSQYYIDLEEDERIGVAEYSGVLKKERELIFQEEYEYQDCVKGYIKSYSSCDAIMGGILSRKKSLEDKIASIKLEKAVRQKRERENKEKEIAKKIEQEKIAEINRKKMEYQSIIKKRQKEFDKIKDDYRIRDGKENIFSKTQYDENLYDLRKKLYYDAFLYQDCLDGYLDNSEGCDVYKIDKQDIKGKIEKILNSYR